jgi:putative pyoverdin transport system ATP-binding/permease protein
MRLLVDLARPHALLIALSAAASLAAGAATVALIARINDALVQPAGLHGGALWAFVGLCLAAVASRVAADLSNNRIGQAIQAQLRKSLARRILAAPIDELERFRTHRLIPVLMHDASAVGNAVFMVSGLVISSCIALGCLAYLAWLSMPMFAVFAAALAAGASLQYLVQVRGVKGFYQARDAEDALHKAWRSISEGAKELRLNRQRRRAVHTGQVVRAIDSIRDTFGRALNLFILGQAYGSGLLFLLIGLMLTAASRLAPEPGVLSGFVLVLLYLKGHIDAILSILPSMGQLKVSFERVADLNARFANPEPHLDADVPEPHRPAMGRGIELRAVRYAYPAGEGTPPFEIGPIDLALRPGEIVFIAGDNGSGKTTLIKLLLGLYVPQSGEVLLDGRSVGAHDRDGYRQLFSTVLSDFFLFEELDGTALPEAAGPWLARLEIGHKVAVQDGRFSTTDLSTGQRKRLALVHAYLEARPVLVFDEWAADQDPAFRHLFYTELLPELRERGHTVVAISHDDRYFHIADRLLQMADGGLREVERRGQ